MKQLFPLAFATLLLVTLLACQQTATTSNKSVASNPATGEIDSAEAVAAIMRWDSARPEVQQALMQGGDTAAAVRVPYAFQIPKADITSLANIMPPKATHLYAMLAIQIDSAGHQLFTIIFQAPDANGVTRYYDFTMPCPPCDLSSQ
ncbi:MAG: hypothetical protein IT259_01085 [Saprospiraceae bacterium]|nr:hypothetical protein [Saprospiraceae bacterium]